MKNEKPRVWTLSEDEDMNDRIDGPSLGIYESVKVVELSAYQKAVEALKRLEKYVAHNGDDWVQRESRAVLQELGEGDAG